VDLFPVSRQSQTFAVNRYDPRNLAAVTAFSLREFLLDPRRDPDVQQMLALQRGDLEAFDLLFRKHLPGVVRFASRFVGSTARAEELAQDVFLQIYKTRDRYEPTAQFKTWLYRMVNNACLSELRSADRKRRGTVPAYDDERPNSVPGVPESALPPTRSSEETVLGLETAERLRRGVDALPVQQRAALLLTRSEGLSYEDVAVALDTTVPAVKSLIHRATVSLGAFLGDHDKGAR